MSDFDFDSVYDLNGQRTPDEYAPDVTLCDYTTGNGDVEVDNPQWGVVTGKTGQYGYNGAVMHPSETASDELVIEWVREADGDLFAIVEVRDVDGSYPDGDPIGWAVAYRKS